MFDKKTAPSSKYFCLDVFICSNIGYGLSYMEMSFNITKNDPKFSSKGFVEVLINGCLKHRLTLHLKNSSKQ